MDDKPMAAQSSVPNQPAAEAQETLAGKSHYSGGNALLDAKVEAGTQVGDPVGDQPIATNLSKNHHADDRPDRKNLITTGAYPVDQKQFDDAGDLSIAKDSATPD